MKKQKQKLIGRTADDWAEKLWDRLLEKISQSKSKNEIKKVLENILSFNEKKILLRRLAILALVRSGKSYQEIEEALWVSPQTISVIKKGYASQSGQYQSDRSMRKNKGSGSSKNSKDNTKDYAIEDFILNFIGFPMKFWEAFSAKGIGVMGDRNMKY